MPEQTFRSPGFHDREIDDSAPAPQDPVGIPAGLIGTANRGPAFVPVTVGNFDQFVATFGGLDPKRFGPYAANAFLANRSSLTFLRVLGAGANSTAADVQRTQATGRVVNAGFHVDGQPALADGRHTNAVQFIAAQHSLRPNEAFGQADFTDNDSFRGGTASLIRGIVFMASGSRMMIASADKNLVGAVNNTLQDFGSVDANGRFKLIISTSLGNGFFNNDSNPGVRILTASLNPSDVNYYARVLNTDPDKFFASQHFLYADFALDDELATPTTVAVLSGSANVSLNSGDTTLAFRKAFGAFDTRYKVPTTRFFISQPYGSVEYDLFRVEALDDGAYANDLYKISIANVKASLDPANPYGTFTLQVRDWNDTDINPIILEQFSNCTLDPRDSHYVARLVGDRKLTYNFDASDPNERRVIASGKYPNVSKYVRVVMADAVDRAIVPGTCLPFGFRGATVIKTNDTLTDNALNVGSIVRLGGVLTGSAVALSGSIVPPVPFRTKVTKGQRPAPGLWLGQPGINEISVPLYYWGVKFERNNIPLDPNLQTAPNTMLSALTQYPGIRPLDVVVTGSGADQLCNNKFTLSKVAFSNGFSPDLSTVMTASIDAHMREAAYVRNAKVDGTTYTINDGVLPNRITFATILSKGTPAQFNRFSSYAKFTTFMQGGFDGVNVLDPTARRMNDRAVSFDLGGAAEASYVPAGFVSNQNGAGQLNSTVASYVAAANIMTDPLRVNHNLLAVPGIREPFVTDYVAAACKSYGLAYYVMDIAKYDEQLNRLYDDSTLRADVNQTAVALDSRAIDNNYVGTYFPDVFIDDATNKRRVKVPASVAALSALGFNDRVSYPWFAPAGFNRAALDFVSNVEVRLTAPDRNRLSDSRINPIATFPRQGIVIFDQKTLQVANSALNRVNVRRMLLEVKRIIIRIALQLEFERNTIDVRNKFTADANVQLALIKAQSGIENFNVIVDDTNNTDADVDQNRLNGRVMVVPTRTIENIAVDFIITNSGVAFV